MEDTKTPVTGPPISEERSCTIRPVDEDSRTSLPIPFCACLHEAPFEHALFDCGSTSGRLTARCARCPGSKLAAHPDKGALHSCTLITKTNICAAMSTSNPRSQPADYCSSARAFCTVSDLLRSDVENGNSREAEESCSGGSLLVAPARHRSRALELPRLAGSRNIAQTFHED